MLFFAVVHGLGQMSIPRRAAVARRKPSQLDSAPRGGNSDRPPAGLMHALIAWYT
jgi:hypothetical protein